MTESNEVNCCFCGDEVIFEFSKEIVRISIEFAEDGAAHVRKYWAHTDCLPQELLTND